MSSAGEEHLGLGYADPGHRELLARAAEQAAERGLDDVFIVDSDFHVNEQSYWRELLELLDDEVVRHMLKVNGDRAAGSGRVWVPAEVSLGGMQEVAGRIQTETAWAEARAAGPAGAAGEVELVREAMALMGTDCASLFPDLLLGLGTNRFPELEPAIADAHARWLTERVFPHDERIKGMLYLPWSDPDACVRVIEEFGARDGVVGFMITSVRYEATASRPYMKVYRALEERGAALGFHSAFDYYERSTAMFNNFLSVHAIGFPYYNLVHATNLVINGIPESFPGLKFFFIEGGLSWVPFLMQRLDSEYTMRPSEAPALERLPSEYLREFFYTTQPLEATRIGDLQHTMEVIGAPSQLTWASDWPHWDWDPPSRIWDLPFLDEAAKRDILGGNARRLFGLTEPSNQDAKGGER